jgi:hypothetical protein
MPPAIRFWATKSVRGNSECRELDRERVPQMKRIRISLQTLLILVTAAALILGYGQARRREILKNCSELKAYGYRFDVPNSFRDFVWQRKPVVGIIKILGGKEVLTGITLDWKGQQFSSTTDARDIEIVKKLGMCEFKEYE